MKEVTVVTTCEITGVYHLEDETCVKSNDELRETLMDLLEADHVVIKKNQVFVRDLPNTSEVVVETPETAVQGG